MKKTPDPVVEKLDEILKTLKRIEAKPAFVPNTYPYYVPYMPTYPTYPAYPYFTWTSGTSVFCNTNDTSANGDGAAFTFTS